MPTVVLLAFLINALHGAHLLQQTDDFFMQLGVQALLTKNQARQHLDEDRIQILQATAAMRVRELESKKASDKQIERVGGVRPIARSEFATLLAALAARLDARPAKVPNTKLPRVIAIDVDVTPLDEKDDGKAIAAALDRLRKHAAVVAIVLQRPTLQEREARNRFMTGAAGCTRSGKQDAPAPPGTAAKHKHPLYFASPSIFQVRYGNQQSFARDFPFAADSKALQRSAWQPVNVHFPSLSNLISLSAWPKDGPAQALTLLCDQAAGQPEEELLLQDIIAEQLPAVCGPSPQTPVCQGLDFKHYVSLGTNWALQDSGLLSITEIDAVAQLAQASGAPSAVGEDALDAGVLLLSIDGGSSHDKFAVPSGNSVPVSGATVHALQALSSVNNRHVDLDSIAGFFADIFAGLVFLLLWQPIKKLGFLLLPSLRDFLRIAGPLAIAGLLGWVSVEVLAPMALHCGHWLYPEYLLGGMALHAYAEGTAAPASGHGKHTHAADFSFGLSQVLLATSRWRARPWGSVREAMTAAKASGLLDAAITMAAKWAVLCAGLRAIHSTEAQLFVGAALLISAALSVTVTLKREKPHAQKPIPH